MRVNLKQRVWHRTWTWVIPSSSFMKLCEEPGTVRASWSLSPSCSCPPGRTTLTITSRSLSRSAFIRSSRMKFMLICFYVVFCKLYFYRVPVHPGWFAYVPGLPLFKGFPHLIPTWKHLPTPSHILKNVPSGHCLEHWGEGLVVWMNDGGFKIW